MSRFEGRVAVVTGAGQGIGAAVAQVFAEQGASVGVIDVVEENAARTVKTITDAGGTAMPLACNVADRDNVESSMQAVADAYGRLDILANNAGIVRDALVYKMTDEQWDAVLDVNLKGAWLCSQVAQRYMVPQEYGKIVMTASRSALGGRGQTNYSSAKAGMLGLAGALAWELGRYNINVNAVAPGHVTTDMTKGTAERLGNDYEEIKKQRIAANAVKRVAEPRDIANVIAFLASDDARYVTGQTIYATGRPHM